MKSNPETMWAEIPPRIRKPLIWTLWFITWAGLIGGLFQPAWYSYVVFFSVVHASVFLALHGFRAGEFSVQVRLAYLAWVAAGTYVPPLTPLLHITTAGLAANLFFRYCLLARMVYLLPWNRKEPWSLDLVVGVFLSPPVPGRFRAATR